MTLNFLDHIRGVEDHRVAGMVNYPLDEILLTTLVGLLCRAEDWDEIELICREQVEWLRRFLPFKEGIAQAQTYRRVFQLLDPKALERAFGSWVASLQEKIRGVVAIDGKTVRGSKRDAGGDGALHVLSAYAHEAGLVIGQRAVDAKSNEITAIPELLECLALAGAIVTIDAMGCQTKIADAIIENEADYILALKGNQGTLLDDVMAWFNDPDLAAACPVCIRTETGHGRIEERTCRVADAGWLAQRHPGWTALNSIVQITSTRTDKKTGAVSTENRFYIASLSPDPETLLDAIRDHWSVENNLHWHLDVTFREDYSRTRKDHSAMNFTVLRRFALNMLAREPSKLPLKRKRLKAAVNPEFRASLLAC
jgi:predicted transposase YbfD/YdcC